MVACEHEIRGRFDAPNYSYWMYLVVNELLENYGPLENFIQLVMAFGRTLEDKVNVITPSPGAYRDTRLYVLDRPWDLDTKADLEKTIRPFILILRQSLPNFAPEEDEFIVLEFPEALGDSERYVELFSEIANEIHSGKDLFEWRRAKKRKEVAGSILSRLAESIELKPGALGFSIDIKKLLTGK